MDMTTKGVIASASSLRKNEIDVFLCVCLYGPRCHSVVMRKVAGRS